MQLLRVVLFAVLIADVFMPPSSQGEVSTGVDTFRDEIRPLLENYCFDCHADGEDRGQVAFDQFQSDAGALDDRELWLRVLKNVRADLMPPRRKAQPSAAEQAVLEHWIKQSVFAIDPARPDPGRTTIRRLNRTEYRNTIRDLLDVDYDTRLNFPPDDSGHGFDNIADVLTLPPMLLEKYVLAAHQIVDRAVPASPAESRKYRKFFPRAVPVEAVDQRAYAEELIAAFARRAFRRPPAPPTLERLVNLAETTYSQPDKTFEAGIKQAMVAILASPRFLFREELPEPNPPPGSFPDLDEYSLASRLSYFLWSSTPDDELLSLAESGTLRENLDAQVKRMLASRKSEALVQDFGGQWLRSRDIEGVSIDARAVRERENYLSSENRALRRRFGAVRRIPESDRTPEERKEFARLRRELDRADLTPGIRRAMRQETESYLAYVLNEDRSLLELIDSDYTFLNEDLAAHYGIPDVTGPKMRLVKLPADSPRGGILTQGTVLGVTSNPTRTSPVKRGVFVLDNILGTPPPPPPPDIPPLEDAAPATPGHTPSLRETLARHREEALCASCHNRMDPIGLAFENFNALGLWRDREFDEAIDPSGRLITGEEFKELRDLKSILAQNHAVDFYRTVTEKMLTYALGRGLEYYDVETCDQIVARLVASDGKPSELIDGVIRSAPFQKMRPRTTAQVVSPITSSPKQ